ncbi:MAG TPA: hypothetical protein VJ505_14355 [Holophagaceae bacterium]|nr:hypothetical protein [Holophagaceae bacterium]
MRTLTLAATLAALPLAAPLSAQGRAEVPGILVARPAQLSIHSQKGAAVVDPDGHTFMIRMEGMDAMPGGVRLKLRLGNVYAAVVEGFTLQVRVGGRTWDQVFTESIGAGQTLEVAVPLTDLEKVPTRFAVGMTVEHWGFY